LCGDDRMSRSLLLPWLPTFAAVLFVAALAAGIL
jgi:hypothetical protein